MRNLVIPELGENINQATVIKILVAVGDKLEVDQVVLELETDKATIEVPSDIAGTVAEIKVAENDVIKIGQTVFVIDDAGSASETVAAPAQAPAPIVEAAPAPAAPVETPAAPVVTPAPVAAPAPVASGTMDSAKVIPVENQPAIVQNAAPAAPSVRRLAREIGVDVNQIKGSGIGGRITLDDVKAFSKTLHQQRNDVQHIRAEQHQEPLPDFTKFGNVTPQPMSNIRFKTAEHLSYAWHTIPHVTQFDKADITALEEFRKMYAKTADKQGVKITATAIMVKIIASALKKFPQFNSSVDMHNKQIIYKDYFNIGIAVDTEFGLVVPVVKRANELSVIEIAREINVLAEKARNKKLGVADMQGGCFTITNLGGIGGTAFTPIVNAPEVAILGMSRSAMEPVYIDGKFEARLMLPLSLSYDHRVIDGADGIRFLRWIIEAIEQPMKFVIEG